MPRPKNPKKAVVNRLRRKVESAARAVKVSQKEKKLRAGRKIRELLTKLG